jgi:hypothetical protein
MRAQLIGRDVLDAAGGPAVELDVYGNVRDREQLCARAAVPVSAPVDVSARRAARRQLARQPGHHAPPVRTQPSQRPSGTVAALSEALQGKALSSISEADAAIRCVRACVRARLPIGERAMTRAHAPARSGRGTMAASPAQRLCGGPRPSPSPWRRPRWPSASSLCTWWPRCLARHARVRPAPPDPLAFTWSPQVPTEVCMPRPVVSILSGAKRAKGAALRAADIAVVSPAGASVAVAMQNAVALRDAVARKLADKDKDKVWQRRGGGRGGSACLRVRGSLARYSRTEPSPVRTRRSATRSPSSRRRRARPRWSQVGRGAALHGALAARG